MANTMGKARRGFSWRSLGWTAAALMLVAPLVAMEFSSEVRWTPGDFLFAAMLLGLVGLALELAVRTSGSGWYRAGAGAALAAGFFIIWANGAVGMIGNEDNPYNLLFLGVIALALVGSILARFRAAGMAIAMMLSAAAQILIGAGGIATDSRGAIFSILFSGLWLLAGALFHNAAKGPTA